MAYLTNDLQFLYVVIDACAKTYQSVCIPATRRNLWKQHAQRFSSFNIKCKNRNQFEVQFVPYTFVIQSHGALISKGQFLMENKLDLFFR